MASEMSSLIRFYQGGSNTAESSNQGLASSPPDHDLFTSSIQMDSSQTVFSSILLRRVDNLPTPYDTTTADFTKNAQFDGKRTRDGGTGSASIFGSFFSIPLRLFSLNRGQKHRETEIITSSGPSSSVIAEQAGPIDIISDSPVEHLLPDAINGDDYDNDEEIEANDSILDDYVKYVYHQQELDYAREIEDNHDETLVNATASNDTFTIEDTGNNVNTTKHKSINAENQSDEPHTLENIPHSKLNEPDPAIPRTSTLSRIKLKTRVILKQLSLQYENERKVFNANSLRAKEELKRNLSNVNNSIRRQTSQKWNHWSRRGTSNDTYGFPYSAYDSVEDGNDEGMSSRGRSLLDLFQSPTFTQRLQEGFVAGRKSYNDENAAGDHAADNAYVTYKSTNETKGHHSTGPKRSRSIQDFAKHLFTLRPSSRNTVNI